MKRRAVWVALGFVVLVVSPAGVFHLLTSSDDAPAKTLAEPLDPLEMTQAEKDAYAAKRARNQAMLVRAREASLGTWELTEGTTTLRFRLVPSTRPFDTANAYVRRESSIIGTAHACGTHSLVAEAGACVDEFFFPVDIQMIAGTYAKPIATVSTVGGNETYLRVKLDDKKRFSATLVAGKVELDDDYERRARKLTLRRISL